MLHESINRTLEAHVHDPIGFVQHEDLQVVNVESESLIQVLQHAPRRAHQDVHAVNPLGLFLQALPSDDQTRREVVIAPNLAQHVEDLHGELARWRYDERPQSVIVCPLRVIKFLEQGDEEGEGFAGAGLRGGEEVVAFEGKGYGAGLDVGEGLEVRGAKAGGSGVAEGEVGEVCGWGGFGILWANV